MSDVEFVIEFGELLRENPQIVNFLIGFFCGSAISLVVYFIFYFIGKRDVAPMAEEVSDMAQHEYKCQSCFHRDVCPEYHPETYSCVHHVDEADVAPRAEVAREIFEELEQESFGYADEDGDWFCIYEKDYEEIQKKHLAATGTNDSGKDMI